MYTSNPAAVRRSTVREFESGRQNIVFRVKLVIMRSACFTPGHGIRDK